MRFIGIAVLSLAYYMLLAGEIGVEQCVSAVILTLFTLGWTQWMKRRGDERRIAPSIGQCAAIARAFSRLPGDAISVAGVLARTLFGVTSPGRAGDRPFHFGERDDAKTAGRRAAAIIAGSLTPDTIIVTIEPNKAARTHRVLHGPEASDSEWLA